MATETANGGDGSARAVARERTRGGGRARERERGRGGAWRRAGHPDNDEEKQEGAGNVATAGCGAATQQLLLAGA